MYVGNSKVALYHWMVVVPKSPGVEIAKPKESVSPKPEAPKSQSPNIRKLEIDNEQFGIELREFNIK